MQEHAGVGAGGRGDDYVQRPLQRICGNKKNIIYKL